jgi:hypothetical protein
MDQVTVELFTINMWLPIKRIFCFLQIVLLLLNSPNCFFPFNFTSSIFREAAGLWRQFYWSSTIFTSFSCLIVSFLPTLLVAYLIPNKIQITIFSFLFFSRLSFFFFFLPFLREKIGKKNTTIHDIATKKTLVFKISANTYRYWLRASPPVRPIAPR